MAHILPDDAPGALHLPGLTILNPPDDAWCRRVAVEILRLDYVKSQLQR